MPLASREIHMLGCAFPIVAVKLVSRFSVSANLLPEPTRRSKLVSPPKTTCPAQANRPTRRLAHADRTNPTKPNLFGPTGTT